MLFYKLTKMATASGSPEAAPSSSPTDHILTSVSLFVIGSHRGELPLLFNPFFPLFLYEIAGYFCCVWFASFVLKVSFPARGVFLCYFGLGPP